MKVDNRNLVYVLAIIILILCLTSSVIVIIYNQNYFRGHTDDKKEECLIIGVAQSDLREPWQITINEEINNESKNYDNLQIIYVDAAGNDDKQISDINKLMKFGIDLLIISPTNPKVITSKVSEVYNKIPVIVLDRGVEGYDYNLYIGPDNLRLGNQVGEYIVEALGEKGGNVIEIRGPLNNNATMERSLGLVEELSDYKNINIIEEITVDWNRDRAEDKMYDIFNTYPDIDVVFAHNDAMALGAYTAYKNLNYEHPVKFIGIDGLVGEKGGLDLVEKSVFACTFICPTGGKEAIQYAMDILNKENGIPKKVILRSTKITNENLKEYKDEKYKKMYIEEKEEAIKLGFCNVGKEGDWREANTKSIKDAAKEFGIELIYAEADLSLERQIDILRGFIKMGVDVISFSPVVEDGFDEVLLEAREAGIPVVLADRTINSDSKSLYDTFLGSDFREEGRRAARWITENMDISKIVNVVEIQGILGSTPTVERKIGFEEIINEHDNINIINTKSGEYTFEGGKKVMEDILDIFKGDLDKIDVVYAHNDDMALGAIEAIEEANLKPGEDIKIVSIDGIKEAIKAIKDGKLNCSVECNPIIGPQIMKIVKDIVNGKDSPAMIITEETVFTEENFTLDLLNRKY